MNNPVVAISSEFMNAFAAIPKKQQGKVLEFITKFRANPTASSINYEKIAQFKDDSLRSVRIDQTYRGIVKPETGMSICFYGSTIMTKHTNGQKIKNVSLMLKQEACKSTTSMKQRLLLQSGNPHSSIKAKSVFMPPYMTGTWLLGIPEELLPLVRNICTDEQLDRAAQQLPIEAHEALTALAAGYTLDEVLRQYDRTIEDSHHVDIDDYQEGSG